MKRLKDKKTETNMPLNFLKRGGEKKCHAYLHFMVINL